MQSPYKLPAFVFLFNWIEDQKSKTGETRYLRALAVKKSDINLEQTAHIIQKYHTKFMVEFNQIDAKLC